MRGIEQFLQVDAATLGALKYAGTWNASTNTPTLASGVGVQGQYYVVSVAGSTNLDGETAWQVGDWAVFNGTVWQKVDGGSTGLLSTLTVTGNTFLATTSGSVGVGTTSILAGMSLDVDGLAAVGTQTAVPGIGGNIRYRDDTGTQRYAVGILGAPAETGFSFYDVVASTERMRITSAGDVGIGTGSPVARLTVSGIAGNGNGLMSVDGSDFIRLFADASFGSAINWSAGDSLRFATSDSSFGSFTERMRITAAGDVFVGASSQAFGEKFQIYGNYAVFNNASYTGFIGQGSSLGTATASDFGIRSSNALAFLSGGATERMRITSAGDVGIGTSSPAYKLDVAGTTYARLTTTTYLDGGFINARTALSGGTYNTFDFVEGSTITGYLRNYGSVFGSSIDNHIRLWNTQSAPITFGTNNTERMRIDSAGNLGLGVTPSAWDASERAIQLPQGSIAGAYEYGITVSAGAYRASGGGWVYTQSAAPVSQYRQLNGAHAWFTAPSGTAGNAITFTQAMTLDASGNLGIGVTTPGSKLHVTVANSGTFQTAANFTNDSNADFQVSVRTNETRVGPSPSIPLIFANNGGTERARIPAAGGMVVGTAALATTATDGFLYVPTCAGAPTGTPTTQTGTAPIVVDTTNNKLYFYSGGQWRDAGP